VKFFKFNSTSVFCLEPAIEDRRKATPPLQHLPAIHAFIYWGACSPFVSIGMAKSIVLTNELVSKLGRAAAFGRTWLCVIWPQLVIGFCSLLSLCLAFSVFFYLEYYSN
jgi:hypothetical protein